jgi:membrane protein
MRTSRHRLKWGRDFRPREFLHALWIKYGRDEIMDIGGALTFYTFLAIFPFLLFLVTLASRLLTPAMTQGLLGELAHVAPAPVTDMIGDRVQSLHRSGGIGLLMLSLLGALWSSMTAVVSLMTALNRAYGVKETRGFWRVHGIAFLTTLILSVLVVAAAGISVAIPFLADVLGGQLGGTWALLRFPVSGLIMILALAISYRFLPNVHSRQQVILPGSAIGVTLWLLTSWGFSAYVRNIGTYEVLYGALGGVAILLLWMWLTSQVFLLGAEINVLLTPGGGLDRVAVPHEDGRMDAVNKPLHQRSRRLASSDAKRSVTPEPRR